MNNPSTSIEDYLGAIFRLHPKNGQPLPLADLQEHFGFSPISIHEMIQKLEQRGLVEYIPYKGVRLTSTGFSAAAALVRRHRIWECFLANALRVPIDDAHDLAGNLEHAVPDWITERLFTYLQQPDTCPHGNAIDEVAAIPAGLSMNRSESGRKYLLTRINPENANSLLTARETGLLPGEIIRIVEKTETETSIEIHNLIKKIKSEELSNFWGLDMADGT